MGGTSLPPDQTDIIQSRNPEIYDPLTWIPTSFYLGKGSIQVEARGDVLVGPTVNTFLLPQGLNNKIWYKTYFSTYAADSSVGVVSLGGNITHRNALTLPQGSNPVVTPTLLAWMFRENLLAGTTLTAQAANYQPWIRLVESSVDPFSAVSNLMPGTLKSTAFGGNINLTGDMTLAPSAEGTLELLAAGSINGISPTGRYRLASGNSVTTWTGSKINVSDSDPARIPGTASPFAANTVTGRTLIAQRRTSLPGGLPIDTLLNESGSTTGVFGSQVRKQLLHGASVLHLNDSNPLRIYGNSGDVSGLSLFTPKAGRVIAGRDITDISFYIQNTGASDISLVSAGRDLIPFSESSALRST
ncbi:MAG: hypothetical protein EOP86_25065, partial [Verrucomicrobiaceae bacterium]